MIGAFYGYGKDHFASTEDLWEGIFSLIASVIITIMGAALLRVTKLQEKWRVKLAQALEAKPLTRGTFKNNLKLWAEKYAMFLLPFITVLREGLEAVVFIGGVSLSFPATAFPLPVFTGILAGVAIGYLLYRYVEPPESAVFSNADGLQRRKPSLAPNLPDHLDVLPLPGCSWPLLPRRMVSGEQYLEPPSWW
jgi:F0F1-type ATP synthase assembly protein I